MAGLTPAEQAEYERMKRHQEMNDALKARLLGEFVKASGLALERGEAVLDAIWEPFRKVLAEEFLYGYREADKFRKDYVTGLLPESQAPRLEDMLTLTKDWARRTVLIHTAILKMDSLVPLEVSREVADLNQAIEEAELRLRSWLP